MQKTVETFPARRKAQLRLPMQAAPIERNPSAGAMSTGPGVEADGWFDDALGVVSKVGGVAGPILGSLGI